MKRERGPVQHAFFGRDRDGAGAACLLSVDVEDWYHILDLPTTPPLAQWATLPARVEGNFHHLLDIFEEKNVRTTCFFLGWIAGRFPGLVRRAAAEGHEIASHGYAHRLVYDMTPEEFLQDATRSRRILEDISGHAVLGYRAPGFSVTRATPWFFDKVAQAGYRYDSSVFPARRNHGGLSGALLRPYSVTTAAGELIEFPATVTKVLGGQRSFFGGGYLRLAPMILVRRMILRVLRENRPVIFYVHPREIDPGQPRLKMRPHRHFQSYVNLETTKGKIQDLLDHYEVISFGEFLRRQTESACEVEVLEKRHRVVSLGKAVLSRDGQQ